MTLLFGSANQAGVFKRFSVIRFSCFNRSLLVKHF